MHLAAWDWVAKWAPYNPGVVLDIGGRNINGSVRNLFPEADFTALDIAPGDEVDIIADAATWTPDRLYDLVTCCEVFEHTSKWRGIIRTAYLACKPGGTFIVTCAGPGRAEHSGHDGGPLQDDEWYENIPAELLSAVIRDTGFRDLVVDFDELAGDSRCAAVKP